MERARVPGPGPERRKDMKAIEKQVEKLEKEIHKLHEARRKMVLRGPKRLPAPRLAGSPNVVEQELEEILHQAAKDYGLTPGEIESLLENSRALIDGATNVPASQVAHHFNTPTCSFCQANQRSARRLIAAPRAFICDQCVASAVTLLPLGKVG